MPTILTVNPTKAPGRRKFSDERLIELHSQGLSIPKMAKQLGVSQQPVRERMKKLGLKPNFLRGGVARYKKVGTEDFRCRSCRSVKPLRQRTGTICCKCTHDRYVSKREGALHFRYNKKRCYARAKGIPFTLTFEDYKGQYEKQAGKDGYTGQQMAFDFGQGRSGATMSLDRIDNEKGYTPDSVVFCSLYSNGKKKDLPVGQFMEQLNLDFPKSG